MKPIDEDEIIKIIAKFDQNKSPGHDGIGKKCDIRSYVSCTSVSYQIGRLQIFPK